MSKSEIVLGHETVIASEVLKSRIRKREDTGKYIEQTDGYECRDCGAEILATKHPLWNSPFPTSGTGRCVKGVPYCPKCEEKPRIDGSPVAPKGSYHNP